MFASRSSLFGNVHPFSKRGATRKPWEIRRRRDRSRASRCTFVHARARRVHSCAYVDAAPIVIEEFTTSASRDAIVEAACSLRIQAVDVEVDGHRCVFGL